MYLLFIFKNLQINLFCYQNLTLYNHINSILGVTSVPKRLIIIIILTLWFGVVIYNHIYLILGHLVFHESFSSDLAPQLRFQDKWSTVISSLIARHLMIEVTVIYGHIWMRCVCVGGGIQYQWKIRNI